MARASSRSETGSSAAGVTKLDASAFAGEPEGSLWIRGPHGTRRRRLAFSSHLSRPHLVEQRVFTQALCALQGGGFALTNALEFCVGL